MLDLLIKYAHDHNLVTEPGFAPKTVRWCLSFDSAGNFLGVMELGDTSSKKNPGQTFPACPDLQQREMIKGGVTRSHFLVETAEVLALLFKDEGDEKKCTATKRKHAFFTNMLREAGNTIPELTSVGEALDDEVFSEGIQRELVVRKAKPDDKITISVGDAFPVESDVWHPWWRKFRAGLQTDKPGKNMMRCFVTGGIQEPLLSHPTVSGLGASTGDRLICFDKDAFTSFGLQQSANCAVCEDAAATYRAALNHLIANSERPLVGARIVHWFKTPVPSDSDVLSWLGQPSMEQTQLTAKTSADNLLKSIREGKRPDLANNSYYALTLSGAGGRIMVRDWMEGSFEELVESVGQWFDNLQIVNIYGSKPAKDPGIGRIVTSLLPPEVTKQDSVQPQARALWKSALRKNIPIPYSALAKAVMLNTRFILSGKFEDALDASSKTREHVNNISLVHTRMALIKAYHIRKNGGNSNVMPYLNEEHPNPAYQCGRLMAILRRIQWCAMGNVGASVIQRFYGAASSTPAVTFPRLISLSNHHIAKISSKYGPNLANWYTNRVAEIMGQMTDSIRKTHTLEEQSLFALGYYQQIASDNERKPEKQLGLTDEDIQNIETINATEENDNV